MATLEASASLRRAVLEALADDVDGDNAGASAAGEEEAGPGPASADPVGHKTTTNSTTSTKKTEFKKGPGAKNRTYRRARISSSSSSSD